MATLHGEILCAHPIVHGHGNRRRRCVRCGKTWTRWARRRGRKPRPRRFKLLRATFAAKLTLVQQAHRRTLGVTTWAARHRALLRALTRQPYRLSLPAGPLVLISDGLWFKFNGVRWVLYLMGIRPTGSTKITFLPPILQPGHESQERWREAIQTIPESIRSRIAALVSDDFRGVEAIAGERGWVLQLCHFHLLAYLQSIRGGRKSTVSGRWIRQRAYQAVCQLLVIWRERTVVRLSAELRWLSRRPDCPRRWRGRIRQFLRQLGAYRAYQRYPSLNLPTTTNAIESLNSRLRELASRSRGFRTPSSLERWVQTYVRFNPTGVCNGKNLHN